MTQDLRPGRLLVASVGLMDPNFRRAVVLVCEVNDDGAVGLILNRASESPVGDYLPEWQVSAPAVVFVGGPVQPAMAVGLLSHNGTAPVGFSQVEGRVGLFDLATPPELVADAVAELRVFSGYSGWGQGQLEGEVAAGDWLVVDSEREDYFTEGPDDLWAHVLRRQGGDGAILATMPDDPSLN